MLALFPLPRQTAIEGTDVLPSGYNAPNRRSVRRRRISDTIPRADDDGQRSSRRVPVDADVRFLHPITAIGVTVDVSDSGMRVVIDQPLEPGARCVAVLSLPDGDETHERAEVIWSRRASNGWLTGLRFVD